MTKLMKYRTVEGVKTVLVGNPGRKLMPVLMITSSGLSVKKVPLTDERYMTPAASRKKLSGLVRQFRAAGAILGTNKSAKKFLRGVS